MKAKHTNRVVVIPKKNVGFTTTERKLAELCDKTFLKLWTYTSLYNDEGFKKNKKGNELCDLFVYFNNTVLIFSDKEIKYNENKNQHSKDGLSVAWTRWKRRAVDSSIRQIEGAETWVKTHYDRIYFNENCQDKFPFINESNIDKLKIYRIAIANGCPHSLSLGTSIEDFIINDTRDRKGNYIHVFNAQTIEILTKELSTVKEFVQYLERKEIFANSEYFTNFTKISELDLLATYLLSPSETRGNDFYYSEVDFKIESYTELINANDYKYGKKAERPSIIFDQMINHISVQLMAGKIIDTGYEKFEDNQKIIEVLCNFDRLGRRELSKNFIDKFKETKGRMISSRSASFSGEHSNYPDIAIFAIVIFPKAVCKNMNKAEYKDERMAIAQAYATHYQTQHGVNKDIVVIAFDNISEVSILWDTNYENFIKKVYDKGFSLAYRAGNSITEEDLNSFLMMQQKWGILKSSPIRNYGGRVHQFFEP